MKITFEVITIDGNATPAIYVSNEIRGAILDLTVPDLAPSGHTIHGENVKVTIKY